MRVCLADLGTCPAQLPRAENKSILLLLVSRWETAINDAPSMIADSQLTQGEILYMDTKALFVQILRVLPGLTSGGQINLQKVCDVAATSRDPSIVKKAHIGRDMIKQLEELRICDRRDGYKLMVEEVFQV